MEFSHGIWRYARVIAQSKLGDLAAARSEYFSLTKIREAASLAVLDQKGYPQPTLLLKIADRLVLGEIFMAQEDYANAITAFKEAVDLQDQLPYTEPPFW